MKILLLVLPVFAVGLPSAGAVHEPSTAPPGDSRPAAAAGKIEARTISDASYQRQRRIWVYTPPGYDARRMVPYPWILAFDGDEYREVMPLPKTLDTLLAA